MVAPTNSVVITAPAAIAGSLVGAFGSATGTWITARHQDRRNLLGNQIARREALYSDFIGGVRACWLTPCNTTPVIFKDCYQFTRC